MCNNAKVTILFQEDHEITANSDRFYSSHWRLKVIKVSSPELETAHVVIVEEDIEIIDNINEDNCWDRIDQKILRLASASQAIRYGVAWADELIREFHDTMENIKIDEVMKNETSD